MHSHFLQEGKQAGALGLLGWDKPKEEGIGGKESLRADSHQRLLCSLRLAVGRKQDLISLGISEPQGVKVTYLELWIYRYVGSIFHSCKMDIVRFQTPQYLAFRYSIGAEITATFISSALLRSI